MEGKQIKITRVDPVALKVGDGGNMNRPMAVKEANHNVIIMIYCSLAVLGQVLIKFPVPNLRIEY